MLSSIVPEYWRGPIVYVVMSIFVAWHAICLIVGPAPQDNTIARALRPLVEPYLNLLYLNVEWGFFAPVGMSAEFRYIIVDDGGREHTFRPTTGLAWYHPSKLWIFDRYRTIAQRSDAYDKRLIAEYCRKHANLAPVEVRLLEVSQEKEFLPEDHLAGKTALDSEFAKTLILKIGNCPEE